MKINVFFTLLNVFFLLCRQNKLPLQPFINYNNNLKVGILYIGL